MVGVLMETPTLTLPTLPRARKHVERCLHLNKLLSLKGRESLVPPPRGRWESQIS